MDIKKTPDGNRFYIHSINVADEALLKSDKSPTKLNTSSAKHNIPTSAENVKNNFVDNTTTLPEPFSTLDNGNVQANVKDLSTEDWQNIYKAMKKAGYDITSANQAKEVYSRMASDGQYTFNDEQSEAIKEQYNVIENKYARNPKRESAAKKEFGTTYNYAEAGYILSDGSMLDFSEKRNGGTPGMRSQDHREISSVFADDEIQGEYGDNTPYMNEFINEGNIRLMESQGVTIGQLEPTTAQYDRLYNFISRCLNKNGFFYLDISNNKGYTIESREYEDNIKPSKIISDIKAYYKNGELPYVSDLSQFRYSIRNNGLSAEQISNKLEKNKKRLLAMNSVKDLTGKEFAKTNESIITKVAKYFDKLGNTVINRQLGDVDLNKRAVKTDIAHGIGREKAASFYSVYDVIKEGVIVDYEKNWKNRGYDTAIIVAPITIGGEEYYQGCVVIRYSDHNKFYLHEVARIKKDGTSPFKTEPLSRNIGGNIPSVISILRDLANVKSDNMEQEKRYSIPDSKYA